MLNMSSQRGTHREFSLSKIEQNNYSEVFDFLKPENSLENQLLENSCFQAGLFWGAPRFGHPEGQVIYHIKEVLDNIDKLTFCSDYRRKLRLIAFLHDTFKHKEHKGSPRDWTKHHAVLAREFAETYIDDQQLLDIIEFHDEAYHIWLLLEIDKNTKTGRKRLNALLERIGDSIQLYYLFFKCDTQTGDKNQAPVKWFEQIMKGISVVSF